MARHIVLLRGINLGSRNRIAMAELRETLVDAGFDDVRTYVQSGNVVLSSGKSPRRSPASCEQRIAARFGLDIAVVARTRDELAAVVERNPLAKVAVNPKRYQVSFLAGELDPGHDPEDRGGRDRAGAGRRPGREIYAWHPEGVGRSKLWTFLAGPRLGVTATARNWTTVTTLLRMADE